MNTFSSTTRASRQRLLGHVLGAGWVGRCGALLRQLGPYAAIELLLPGGSLIALGLWLYRRHRRAQGLSGTLSLSADRDQQTLDCEESRAASLFASPC